MTPQFIVVVAADPGARNRAQSALPPGRYSVLTAADTDSARELDLPDLPALIVVDGSLPAGDALDFVGDLRADDATRDTPILVLADVNLERAALRAGATAFLDTSLQADELSRLAGALLAQGAPTSLFHQALALLREGRMSAALTAFDRTTEAAGGTSLLAAWSRYFGAQVLEAQGNKQFAHEELDALLADHPEFWRARARMGLLAATPLQGPPAKASFGTERVSASELREAAASPLPAVGADIIVADDSELALAMIVETLEGAGFRVRTASDGMQALNLARAQRPDLMILDGLMPGKTGFDVCKEVKEGIYPTNPPKVFLLSAIYTKTKQRHEAKDLYGVDEVLAKPFDEAQLIALVRKHVGTAAQSGDSPHGASADSARA